jgi:hypothetical protein
MKSRSVDAGGHDSAGGVETLMECRKSPGEGAEWRPGLWFGFCFFFSFLVFFLLGR